MPASSSQPPAEPPRREPPGSGADPPDASEVAAYLMGLQDRVCAFVESAETGAARFVEHRVEDSRGSLGRPRVLSDGEVFERAAVHFSHAVGRDLPRAATARRPELEGRSYEAVSTSLILHPRNPYVPTCHANLRFFLASARPPSDPAWWFGGGFDLTPYYGFPEDAVHWHRMAKAACDPFDPGLYRLWKQACDRYFYLPHRQESRGIGGLFFDDLTEGGFDRCFRLLRSVGDHFLLAYPPILRRRKDTAWGEREREFQLMRRGRYVEFNLLYDRGTRFGLEAEGPVESILASMPPLVRWVYDFQPEGGSPEDRLTREFLRPRDWLDESDGPPHL